MKHLLTLSLQSEEESKEYLRAIAQFIFLTQTPSSLHISEHNQERPHRHAQRTVPMVVLDLVRLKINPNGHRYHKAILSE